MDRYDDVVEAARSVFDQTHDDVELVLISDGNPDVFDRFEAEFGDRPGVRTHCNDRNRGLLVSRNDGADVATGDIVAFLDDDAVAHPEWIERLVAAYEDHDAVAAGGKMVPMWVDGEPRFLPEEHYYLIGATHRGNLQGGETELCERLRAEYGRGVYYVPEAEVAHKVFDYRTDPRWLLDRAFWQGYSKRGMEQFVAGSGDEESAFLGRLLGEFVPGRTWNLLTDPDPVEAKQLVWLLLLTATVGFGYLYGIAKWG
ncbi:glycosyl transferase family A [Halobacteriales archaeon SW_12_69_24]|nr:MAG: glycosyl transferase family A [Halobacteriales archaeon SW_12_69_24]